MVHYGGYTEKASTTEIIIIFLLWLWAIIGIIQEINYNLEKYEFPKGVVTTMYIILMLILTGSFFVYVKRTNIFRNQLNLL
jgi:hypothetical protein